MYEVLSSTELRESEAPEGWSEFSIRGARKLVVRVFGTENQGVITMSVTVRGCEVIATADDEGR
jgi:hypothetical protein